MTRTMELDARKLFPGIEQRVHLDAAGISIVSSAATDAVDAFLAETGFDPGLAHHGPRLDRAREAAARLVGAQPHQIALTTSTTAGLNAIAGAIDVSPGDNIVTSDLEFISIVAPFQERCRDRGGVLRIVESEGGRLPAERIVELIDDRTRAVVLSSVVWTTGYLIDIPTVGRACRQLGVPLVVDGIQQVGAIPFDVEQACVDVLICGGHKWLGSPSGMGLLFATDDFCARHAPELPYAPTAIDPSEDWLSNWLDPDFSPFRAYPHAAGARRFEIGCHHASMSACGLTAAIDVIDSAGKDAVRDHVISLGNVLAAGLAELGLEILSDLDDAHRSGITTFRAGATAQDDIELSEFLRERGIVTAVRYTARSGGVRVSCHLYNNLDDVDALLSAVRARRHGG
jgi:cysteine desulfurase / selenocysteine lyase